MHKLVDSQGSVVFESHMDMAGEGIALKDNSYYRLITCAECCDLELKVYKNHRILKTQSITLDKTKSFAFTTGVGDKYDFIYTKTCNDNG